MRKFYIVQDAPFFVIGSPRSGTTLLRLMLTSHPKLAVPPECGFLIWLYPLFGNWGKKEFSQNANILRFSSELEASRKFETWGLDRAMIKYEISQREPESYRDACSCIYRLFCERVGKESAIWGDKNNYYLSHITTLKTIFPKARFLHIVRDGRDVACSYREVMSIKSDSPYRPSFPVTIDKIAQRWSGDIQKIRQQLMVLDADCILQLRYEDLVANPKDELTRVCGWLGQRFEMEMLQFYLVNRANHLEPKETMDWKRRTYDSVDSSAVGRHAKLLSAKEIAQFEIVSETELRIYRYIS